MWWKELAGLGVILTVIGIIFGYMKLRVDRVETELDRKVSEAMCNQKNHELIRDMQRGEKAFEQILEEQGKMSKLLTQIDTTVKLLLKNSDKSANA